MKEIGLPPSVTSARFSQTTALKSSLWEGTIISLHGKIFIASTQTRCDLINDGYKIKPTKPGRDGKIKRENRGHVLVP